MLALLVWKLTHQHHAVPVGAQAPAFTLPQLGSPGDVSLASLRGHPVVLNFWASWCPPCKSEAAPLEQEWLRYGGRGIQFVGVDKTDIASDARTFVAAHKLTFPMLVDGSGDVTNTYGVSQLPETYVLNAKGTVVAHLAGPINSPGFAEQFRAALEKVS
jgi:cytochrome c biogenesis protein CcmG/thiol:disulfide interchange protein DsbE